MFLSSNQYAKFKLEEFNILKVVLDKKKKILKKSNIALKKLANISQCKSVGSDINKNNQGITSRSLEENTEVKAKKKKTRRSKKKKTYNSALPELETFPSNNLDAENYEKRTTPPKKKQKLSEDNGGIVTPESPSLLNESSLSTSEKFNVISKTVNMESMEMDNRKIMECFQQWSVDDLETKYIECKLFLELVYVNGFHESLKEFKMNNCVNMDHRFSKFCNSKFIEYVNTFSEDSIDDVCTFNRFHLKVNITISALIFLHKILKLIYEEKEEEQSKFILNLSQSVLNTPNINRLKLLKYQSSLLQETQNNVIQIKSILNLQSESERKMEIGKKDILSNIFKSNLNFDNYNFQKFFKNLEFGMEIVNSVLKKLFIELELLIENHQSLGFVEPPLKPSTAISLSRCNKNVENLKGDLNLQENAHDEKFSKQELLVNPELIQFKIGDLIEIESENQKNKIVLQIGKLDISDTQLSHLQISIAQNIVQSFDLVPRSDVTVRKVDPESVSIDYVEFSFKDQYIGRSQMWKLRTSLIGSCVFIDKRFSTQTTILNHIFFFRIREFGIRAVVSDIFANGQFVKYGYINSNTKVIFRSKSAKYFIFIQMSREMFEFEEDGDLFYEKCVYGFLPELFNRWKSSDCNHIVSIVLFARVLYTDNAHNFVSDNLVQLEDTDHPMSTNSAGRLYRDFYKVVVDWEVRSDWNSVLIPIRQEFMKFQKDILQRKEVSNFFGENSTSSEGNILEALNLAVNPFSKHFVDRDLTRTGLQIIVVTAGTGLFEVDKSLCRLTSQRMIASVSDNGLSLDIVSLSKPPLYTVPLFQFISRELVSSPAVTQLYIENFSQDKKAIHNQKRTSGTFSEKGRDEVENLNCLKENQWDPLYFDDFNEGNPDKYFFFEPQWVDVSFWSEVESGIFRFGEWGMLQQKFQSRAKIAEIQMVNFGLPMNYIVPQLTYLEEDFLNNKKFKDTQVQNTINTTVSSVSHLYHGGLVVKNIEFNQITPVETSDSTFESIYDYDRYDENVFRKPLFIAQPPVDYAFYQSRTSTVNKNYTEPELIRNLHHAQSPPFYGSSLDNNKYYYNNENVNAKIQKSHLSSPDLTKLLLKHEMELKKNYSFSANHQQQQQLMKPPESTISNLSPNIVPLEIKKKRGHDFYHQANAGSIGSPNNRSNSLMDTFRATKGSPGTRFSPQTFKPKILSNLQNYINPCDPSKNIIPIDFQTKRWHDVDIKEDKCCLIYWKSLLTPACLPISTDFFPSAELLQNFEEYTYTISPTEELEGLEIDEKEDLLTELVSQRLSQVSPRNNFSGVCDIAAIGTLPVTEEAKNETFYLSLGDHVHQLGYDTAKNVIVKRYVKKIAHNTSPYSIDQILLIIDNFFCKRLLYYNWNHLDHLISGYQHNMTDNLRFWRTRFLLIPTETLPQNLNPKDENLEEEELRIIGFNKFVEQLEKVKYIPKNDLSGKKLEKKIHISLSTLNMSAFVCEEIEKQREASEEFFYSKSAERRSSSVSFFDPATEFLTKSSSLSNISKLMQDSADLSIKTRRWHFNFYENCFVGSELVDWMLLKFSDIKSREEAVAFGIELQQKGLFYHMNKRLNFIDGHFFYHLNKEYIKTKNQKEKEKSGWFGNRNLKVTENSNSDRLSPILNKNSSKQKMDQFFFDKIELTRSLILDMDPQKASLKRETAILHYDTVYNPRNCYHFSLNWLVCTGKVVQDMISNWTRTGEKFGLKIIEAPIEIYDDNPFQSVISVPLCLEEKITNKPKYWFEMEILEKFDFLLDLEADEEFPENSTIYSTKSPVRYTQYNGSNLLEESPEGLLSKFKSFCSSKTELEKFYQESLKKFSLQNTTPEFQ
ncbi:vacuolar membrane-associated protein iml1 [Clydaea vesicula]|uniref:Vacuolar membrane-associated protein IML1 n=1 Tax=Clydaea vesicula TaxID=447962 RepID=A0AAD5U6T4_9FUNG|nr:vacuolar membrane-associated protein iml1 [Clydaea vesicula]